MLLMPFGLAGGESSAAPRRKSVYLKDVYIAGSQYHDAAKREAIAALKPGQTLQLKREPDNRFDSSAIAVFTADGRNRLGYIPRHQNRTIARIMDQGVTVTAEIDRISPDETPWRRVWIKVREEI